MNQMTKHLHILLFVLFPIFQAVAHPHIFIIAEVKAEFSAMGLKELEVTYEFDNTFSSDIIQKFDVNGNEQFEKNEVEAIRKGAFLALKKQNYLLHLFKGNTEEMVDEIGNFHAWVEYGIVYYKFKAAYNVSIGNSAEIKLAIFDNTYYTDVSLSKDKCQPTNGSAFDITMSSRSEPALSYYFDQIVPRCVIFSVRRK